MEELERKRSEVSVLVPLCLSLSLSPYLPAGLHQSLLQPSPSLSLSLPPSLTTLFIFVQETRGPTKELEKVVDEQAKVRTT